MKIVEFDFARKVNASHAAIMWNYWDHEHLYVVHENYKDAKIIHENENYAAYLLTYKIPIFRFLTSRSLNIQILEDKNTLKVFNMGFLNLPIQTTITVNEFDQDHSEVKMNYKFYLKGWRRVLEPFLLRMVKSWNEKTWKEDLSLKLRRTKIQRLGFKDFTGLPPLKNRPIDGKIENNLPIKRHKNSPLNVKQNNNKC